MPLEKFGGAYSVVFPPRAWFFCCCRFFAHFLTTVTQTWGSPLRSTVTQFSCREGKRVGLSFFYFIWSSFTLSFIISSISKSFESCLCTMCSLLAVRNESFSKDSLFLNDSFTGFKRVGSESVDSSSQQGADCFPKPAQHWHVSISQSIAINQ